MRTVAQAPASLLLLDYDGTLAPFTTDRGRAYPYPGVAAAMEEILRHGGTRIVVISGRNAGEIPVLLHTRPCPEVWGIHGLQHLKADGTTETKSLDEPTLHALSDAHRWLAYQRLLQRAESKTGALAVHWRGLREMEVEDIRGRVLLGWRPIAECGGLDLLDFDGGVEIRAREANKGKLVRSLLNEMPPNTPVAYLGDDTTDEQAFHAMPDHGLSVLVRPGWRQTKAQLWLEPPKELLDFLERWLKACQKRGTSGTSAAVGKM
jgi:trehalose 6-phosphate phosphatase